MLCPKCGEQIKEGSKFCKNCGNPVISNTREETPINKDKPIQNLKTHREEHQSLLSDIMNHPIMFCKYMFQNMPSSMIIIFCIMITIAGFVLFSVLPHELKGPSKEATSLGYVSDKDYRDGLRKGYSNASEYEAGNSGGFLNAKEYRVALNIGVRTRQELLEVIDGNKVISKCADGMTYEKESCEQKNRGQRFLFNGKVYNVEDPYRAEIKLFTKEGNYADVVFSGPIADNFHKDQPIKFWGTLTHIGTGILTKHDIVDAELE